MMMMMTNSRRSLPLGGLLAILVVLSSTVKAQLLDFTCPEPDGLFAHPEQCDRYFECKNGRLSRKLCADGLVFDPQKTESEDPCDWPQNTKHKCRNRPKLQPPKPGDAFCPRQNGVYPSPDLSECNTFYSCLNGVGSAQKCADGLHFDEGNIGTFFLELIKDND